jgi:Domain of unknown function (DUF3127)
MSFEVTGKLIAKYETVQRTESFKTREFVIEKTDDIGGRIISNFIRFQCVQDRTAIVDRFNLGDDVKVSFNIRGTKWVKDGKENYITNLDAWRMETIKLGENTATPQQAAPQQQAQVPQSYAPTAAPETAIDDLPF